MPDSVTVGAITAAPVRADYLASYRAAVARANGQSRDGPRLGQSIVFDPLQYALFDNVAEAFHFHADLNPGLTHLKQPVIHDWTEGEKQRPVERVTAAEFQRREQRIAHYLRGIGVRAGTRVAIVAADGPHWPAFKIAVWDADGEVVNIYVRNTAERTGFCLIDSGAKIVVVQNQEQLDKLLKVMDRPFTVEGHEERDEYEATLQLERIIAINPISIPEQCARFAPLVHSAEAIYSGPDPPQRLISTRGMTDIANIVYTSGSSGAPKGVLCSHGATLHNLRMLALSGVIDFSKLRQAQSESDLPHMFSSLPERAHAFPMRIGQVVSTSPVIGVYPAEVDKKSNNITPEFRESIGRDHRENALGIEPTVPKILSGLRKKILGNMDQGGVKGKVAKLVALNAARHLRCRVQGHLHNPILDGRNAEWSLPAVRLGNANAFHRLRPKLFVQLLQQSRCTRAIDDVLGRLTIQARSAVVLQHQPPGGQTATATNRLIARDPFNHPTPIHGVLHQPSATIFGRPPPPFSTALNTPAAPEIDRHRGRSHVP